MSNKQPDLLEPQGYTHNEVGAYGIAGTRHEGRLQDRFWPSKDDKLPRPEVVEQLGELYLFSDGVTKCADGYIASQLAVQTVRKHYYGQPPSNDQSPSARLKRLQKAVWQAHLQLARWDEKFYCWRTEKHPDGEATTYTRQELAKWGKFKDGVPRCPLCNEKMDGLAATLLAVVIHEHHLFLVAVGDSFALRIPTDSGRSIEPLCDPKSGEFLGSPILPYRQASLPYREKELRRDDLIVFCSDGVVATLNMKEGKGEKRNSYLRQRLQRDSLSRSVPALIKDLDTFRQNIKILDDDLTLLAVRNLQERQKPTSTETVHSRNKSPKNKKRNDPSEVEVPRRPPKATNYAGEIVGGYGVAGSRHTGPAQDVFWPSPQAKLSPTGLSRVQILLSGRLYLLADGVTLCADGHTASWLAAHTIGQAYYEQPGGTQDTSDERKQRLIKAVWQGHEKVQRWDKKFYCWRKQLHSPKHFKNEEVEEWRGGLPLCPRCGHPMAGLQTTLVAAVLHGYELVLVTVGDSVALRLPANLNEPVEFLAHSKEKNFLGMPGLLSHHLFSIKKTLQPGDQLLFCGDGVIETLNHRQKESGRNWASDLRKRLNTPHLQQEVKRLIDDLDAFREKHGSKLDDDLTLLAVTVPDQPMLAKLGQQVTLSDSALNGSWTISKRDQPQKYSGFINNNESLLWHEYGVDIWRQDGAVLRELALSQIREVAAPDDPLAHNLMRQSVQVGDVEVRNWQNVMQYALQITEWRDDKNSLLKVPVTTHEQIVTTLEDMKLVLRLPEIVTTLRNSLKRVAKELKKDQQRAAELYNDLLQKWDSRKAAMTTVKKIENLLENEAALLKKAETREHEQIVNELVAIQADLLLPEIVSRLNSVLTQLITALKQAGQQETVLLYEVLFQPSDSLAKASPAESRSKETESDITEKSSVFGQDPNEPIELSKARAIYKQIIAELEQKDLHGAIKAADNPQFYELLCKPSADIVRQALTLLRDYEELRETQTTHAATSLKRVYNEFYELKEKLGFEIQPFNAKRAISTQFIIESMLDGLVRIEPRFAIKASGTDITEPTGARPTDDDESSEPKKHDEQSDSPLSQQLDRQTATKMVRQAAKLAFEEGKLAKATQVMVEVASQHPENYLLRKDWKKLWDNPNHDFQLNVYPFFMTSMRFYDLTRLANLLSMAAQIDETLKLAVTFHPGDDQLQIAAKCLDELQTWPKKRQIQKDLPDEVWAIPLTVATKLATARVEVSRNHWENALKGLKNEPNKPPSPELRSARETYATVVWQSFLGFEVRELKRETALRMLERVEWLGRQLPWALALAEAEKLRGQGDIIEAACVAVKMPMPESLGIDEQDQVMKQQRDFVNQAWEIAYGMASGKLMRINNQRLQSAINTLNKAELDQISGYYAVRMCAVHDLLRVFHYEQAKARVSAALICEKFTQYTQLTPLDYEQLLEIRLTRIDQVWGMAFQKAKSNRPIEREERGKLAGIAEKLSEAQDSQLIAAGLLLEAALAFRADKRGEAAEQIVEAWDILENPNKDQVWQLADQIYLHSWDKVHFWQSERRRQLERLRQLADDPRLSSVKSALIRRFDGKTARMRNEWFLILSVLILLLVVGPFLATIWGTDSTSANGPEEDAISTTITASNPSLTSNDITSTVEPTKEAATPLAASPAGVTTVSITTNTPIPTMTATPTDISPTPTAPSVNALATAQAAVATSQTQAPVATSQAAIATSQAQAVVATSQAQAEAEAEAEAEAQATAEAVQTSAWIPPADSPLGVEPVLIEMTFGEVGVRTLSNILTYFGQEGDKVTDELVAMRTLTSNYPGDTLIKPETPLRGMLPADPLFLFVGQAAETPRIHGDDFGFWLNVTDSSGNPPMVFISILEKNKAQIENKQLDQGRWVWVLGSSEPFANALLACRNSLVENGIDAYDCKDQQDFVTGPRAINLQAAVLIRIENGVLQEPLLENAIENRWIYGDLGRDGLQLALSDEARNRISVPTSRLGLVRASWDSASNTIRPSNILARQDNGVYQPI